MVFDVRHVYSHKSNFTIRITALLEEFNYLGGGGGYNENTLDHILNALGGSATMGVLKCPGAGEEL